MTNKLAPKHQIVLDGLINKVHNLQDVPDDTKCHLIEYLQEIVYQYVKDFDKIFIYENTGLLGTGMGWDETYVIFLNRFGYSNLTYQQFNALPESAQNNILENTDIAKAYFQIFTE